MKDKFQMSSMGELTFFLGLQVKQKKDGIFISQDKYVAEILRKFRLSEGKSTSTPIDAEKPLLKVSHGEDVDVHTYRYFKGKPCLGLWYPKDSPFDLVAYSDSDYGGASLDRKSTTGRCQFLGCRLISWQCKKQTVVATSSTEAEYVAAASGCAQVLWMQNQLLDYGDSPLLGVNTPRSDEDRLKLMELMVFLMKKGVCDEFGLNAARLSKFLLSGKCDVTRLQALVDKKRIVITEEVVREILQLNDAEDAAEGFEQIIDFLSGSYINHALTVNPHVYISCIKQFWNTTVVKRSGDVTRLQALVDKKRIVIIEEVVREILQLNDAEGVICLPNEEIFAGLARMGYEKQSTKLTFYKAFFSTQWKFFIHTILHSLSAKRTSWNEFSSAMVSAVICLSSGQRFNFSNYIFESLVRNVDSSSKFYMVRKGFSGVETPLFESMLVVRDVAEEAEAQIPTQGDDVQEPAAEEVATDVVPPTPTSPSPSSPHLFPDQLPAQSLHPDPYQQLSSPD
nr:uncharacterized mitochondrial protein AtMg00810-like [Tanacetum cinerariifolium]